MRAIQVQEYGPAEVMRVESVADPLPDAGQILIEVKAVGVNPVDTYIRAGNYPIKKEFPFTPGFDAAGVVLETGDGVKDFAAGDRVYTAGSISGTYAEKTVCAAGQVHPLPENVSFEQGAALGVPYGTAYRGLFQRGSGAAGKWVLIHGASGGVGIAAVQFAAAAGMNIIATAGTDEGRQMVKENGAQYVIDHNDPDHAREILKIAKHGADLVLEMLANVNLQMDLEVAGPKGVIVVIGSRGTVEIDPRYVMAREIDIRGLLVMKADAEEARQISAAIDKGLRDGNLRPVIGGIYGLDEAAKAHHDIMESAHHGKIVLVP